MATVIIPRINARDLNSIGQANFSTYHDRGHALIYLSHDQVLRGVVKKF